MNFFQHILLQKNNHYWNAHKELFDMLHDNRYNQELYDKVNLLF